MQAETSSSDATDKLGRFIRRKRKLEEVLSRNRSDDDQHALSAKVKRLTSPTVHSHVAAVSDAWYLSCFKDDDDIGRIELPRCGSLLFGRDKTVVDVPTFHHSCSKQHAVITVRGGSTQPHVLDLNSANGTLLNGREIAAGKLTPLRDGDMLRFGYSSREYVLMKEQ